MIRLIGADIDGTLLTTDKRLTPYTVEVLRKASERGIVIVPATGRYFKGMPEDLRALPFIRYGINSNGATVYDVNLEKYILSTPIPLKETIEIMDYLDDFPIIYDCYIFDQGFQDSKMYAQIKDFSLSEIYYRMMRDLRKPIDNLKGFLMDKGEDVHKIQFYMKDSSIREDIIKGLYELHDDLVVTTSLHNNGEINNIHATKGEGLLRLADYLGIDRNETAGFGDGNNDISLITGVSLGIAMGNAVPSLKAVADYITDDCDHDGVAKAIEKYILNA